MRVTPNVLIPYMTSVVKAGITIDVPDAVGKEWKEKGWLHTGRGPTEQAVLQAKNSGTTLGAGMPGRAVFLPVTPDQWAALVDAGLDDPDKVASVDDEILLAVPGITEGVALRIREAIGYADNVD